MPLFKVQCEGRCFYIEAVNAQQSVDTLKSFVREAYDARWIPSMESRMVSQSSLSHMVECTEYVARLNENPHIPQDAQ